MAASAGFQIFSVQFIFCSGVESQPEDNFIFLSSDSSPQGGLDFLLTIEDAVPRSKAAECIDVSDAELATFSALGHLKTSVLPISVIGSGNASLPAKFEALVNSACLDQSNKPALVQKYFDSIVGYCSDYGTEWLFDAIPLVSWKSLCDSNIQNSNGLLKYCADRSEEVEDAQISIQGCLKIPGPKHMYDNLTSVMLEKLSYYPTFQETWTWTCFDWLCLLDF